MQITEIISWSRGDTRVSARGEEDDRDGDEAKFSSSDRAFFVALRNASVGHDFYALLLVGSIDKRT